MVGKLKGRLYRTLEHGATGKPSRLACGSTVTRSLEFQGGLDLDGEAPRPTEKPFLKTMRSGADSCVPESLVGSVRRSCARTATQTPTAAACFLEPQLMLEETVMSSIRRVLVNISELRHVPVDQARR